MYINEKNRLDQHSNGKKEFPKFNLLIEKKDKISASKQNLREKKHIFWKHKFAS